MFQCCATGASGAMGATGATSATGAMVRVRVVRWRVVRGLDGCVTRQADGAVAKGLDSASVIAPIARIDRREWRVVDSSRLLSIVC